MDETGRDETGRDETGRDETGRSGCGDRSRRGRAAVHDAGNSGDERAGQGSGIVAGNPRWPRIRAITVRRPCYRLPAEKQIRRGTHRSTAALEQAITDYLAIYNENPKPFVWTKTADQILESLQHYCKRINDSLH